MSFGLGVASALGAPLVMTLGFVLWENHWKGSAFSLNLFKCNLATIGFVVLSLTTSSNNNDRVFFSDAFWDPTAVGYLFFSSTIGILIGDWTWLQGLQLLGARRVIVLDSLKPFLAALLGWTILGEDLQLVALSGIVLTVAGVVLVSWEHVPAGGDGNDDNDADKKSGSNDDCLGSTAAVAVEEQSENLEAVQSESKELENVDREDDNTSDCRRTKTHQHRDLRRGYCMSLLNVIFDTYGALLIKDHGVGMTVWEINMLRFGFAGIVMLVLSILLHARAWIVADEKEALVLPLQSTTQKTYNSCTQTSQDNNKSGTKEGNDENCICTLENDVTENIEMTTASTRDDSPVVEAVSIITTTPWYALPWNDTMSSAAWWYVSGGVFLTTFLTPSLSNYALFQVTLALALTLGSVGPLYALPLAFCLQNQKPTAHATFGAVLAVAGIAVLAFKGNTNDDGV